MTLRDSTEDEKGVQGLPCCYRKPRFALLLTEERQSLTADRYFQSGANLIRVRV